MGILLEKLKKLEEPGILISDGAWGTILQSKGMTTDDCPEEWNISHADKVQDVAKAYAEAGSDLVLTNTFGGSRIKLEKKGYGDRVCEFNEAGVRNSLAAAGSAIVAGSVGPTGDFIAPLGTITTEEMEEIFAQQIQALLKGGVRVICVETMMAVEEAACAIRAAKKLDPTVTVDNTPNGFRTMMGVDPQRAVSELSEAGADILGSNCGNGIEGMIEVAAEFRKHTSKPILIHANAGVPELINGQTVFRQSPEDFAANAQGLVDAGANIIGGCCGTTPQHIAAMKAAVGK
jgi:5-methyltetrahydrofolate--homocysteine methyltransferase